MWRRLGSLVSAGVLKCGAFSRHLGSALAARTWGLWRRFWLKIKINQPMAQHESLFVLQPAFAGDLPAIAATYAHGSRADCAPAWGH